MSVNNDFFLITDVGSTTTKAILIDNRSDKPAVLGLCNSETTVEAPNNDVRIGVFEAISKLQTQTGITLLQTKSSTNELILSDGLCYLTTSSAGGGLQILVIGLTLFDSASSARRAAYGAGGVLLDVFAIDDSRAASDQMQAMRNLRPDMILLCGGIDGGAISGVLRLAEILRMAKPLPKYATNEKIPTIYAGNKDIQDMIRNTISKDFDLHIMPNLRPSLTEENLQPTRDMIQKLFMENVMERAPGYNELKKIVSRDILPTPLGVLNSLVSYSKSESKNFFAFDIGGATTDVFSYIKGQYQRTVSANLGMSYSALNVLSETGIDKLMASLPQGYNPDEVRNYIGNKTLYPTFNPQNQWQQAIEHALAKQAIRLAVQQHQEMHYNTQKIGFLDKLKTDEIGGYEMKFEFDLIEAGFHFYPSEIDVLIGAGGVFSHTGNELQCASILIDGFDAHGITEICLDKSFITPHLGVLANSQPELADKLLRTEAIKRLLIHVRPHFHTKTNKPVMELTWIEDGQPKVLELMPEKMVLLNGSKTKDITIKPLGKCILGKDNQPKQLYTELPIIIDTRSNSEIWSDALEHSMFNSLMKEMPNTAAFTNSSTPQKGQFTKVVTLPYRGEIAFSKDQHVEPNDVVAVNKFNPPRLFIVEACKGLKNTTEEIIRSSILVKENDLVDFDTLIRHFNDPDPRWIGHNLRSPVRGKVEFIDYKTGIIVLSEIQDYSDKPEVINLSLRLGLSPRKAMSYFKKQVGDFVYQGDNLVMKVDVTDGKGATFINSPSTGQITSINWATSEIQIEYKLRPTNYIAHVRGIVSEVVPNQKILISYSGTKLEAKLGLGKRCHGSFVFYSSPEQIREDALKDKVIGLDFCPTKDLLDFLVKAQIAGLVCPGVMQADVVQLLNHELGVINSGNEALPFCILIMEGFGREKFSAHIHKALGMQTGLLVHLEPHTRIRAGVARPFLCFMD